MYFYANITCCGRGRNFNEHMDGQASLFETHSHLLYLISLLPDSECLSDFILFILFHVYNFIVMHVLWLLTYIPVYRATWVLMAEVL